MFHLATATAALVFSSSPIPGSNAIVAYSGWVGSSGRTMPLNMKAAEVFRTAGYVIRTPVLVGQERVAAAPCEVFRGGWFQVVWRLPLGLVVH